MAQDTKIEWAHHTVNLWWGCTEVHEGCDNCYARTLDNRYNKANPHWGNDAPRKVVKSAFNDLCKYQRLAEKAGEVHRVFVGSMMDIFEKPRPMINNDGTSHELTTGEVRDLLFYQISLELYPNLLFLFLTKRPSNINKYIPEEWKSNPPSNVMFGTSVVNQETADKLVPQLLDVKGKKFLSCEPLLGHVKFNPNWLIGNWDLNGQIDWVIAGGESGPHARPMHPDWVRSLRDQCKEYRVPFLFKQWGEWVSELNSPITTTPKTHKHSDEFVSLSANKSDYKGEYMIRVGKSKAGRLLDGVEHNEFPEI